MEIFITRGPGNLVVALPSGDTLAFSVPETALLINAPFADGCSVADGTTCEWKHFSLEADAGGITTGMAQLDSNWDPTKDVFDEEDSQAR